MGMFDDALKKSVPGGNLTKPLIIATGALILAKWLGGGKDSPKDETVSGGRERADQILPPGNSPSLPPGSGIPQSGSRQPQTIDINTPGQGLPDEGLSGGLGGLIDKLRKGGLGEQADSWVGTGPNKPVQPGQLGDAIGKMTISEIAQKAGTTEEDIMEILTQVLPQLVDNLTPQGRIPSQQDVDRYGRRV